MAVGQVLIEEEKMEVGGVKWTIYSYYGKSVGVGWTVACLLFFLFYQAFQLSGNIWLSGTFICYGSGSQPQGCHVIMSWVLLVITFIDL